MFVTCPLAATQRFVGTMVRIGVHNGSQRQLWLDVALDDAGFVPLGTYTPGTR